MKSFLINFVRKCVFYFYDSFVLRILLQLIVLAIMEYDEMRDWTPAQHEQFNRELEQHEDSQRELEKRFTFEGNGQEWSHVCKAAEALHQAKKTLSCAVYPSAPPPPDWKQESHDLISEALRLTFQAQALIEKNAC